jgi:hypothetical protein
MAFNVGSDQHRRLHLGALAVPLDAGADAKVREFAVHQFDATWAATERRLEGAVATQQQVLVPLEQTQGQVTSSLAMLPLHVEVPNPTPAMPPRFSLRWWGAIFLAICFLASSYGAACNVVGRILPLMQSLWLAVPVASVWVMLAVAWKIALGKLGLRGRLAAGILLGVLFAAGVGLWLWGLWLLGQGAAEGMNLVFSGQLMCELPASVAFLCGFAATLDLVSHRKNPLRELYEAQAASSADALRLDQVRLHSAEGELNALRASRLAFADEGLTVLELRRQDETQAEKRRALLGRLLAG